MVQINIFNYALSWFNPNIKTLDSFEEVDDLQAIEYACSSKQTDFVPNHITKRNFTNEDFIECLSLIKNQIKNGDECLERINEVINHYKNGDKCAVIKIDKHSIDESDLISLDQEQINNEEVSTALVPYKNQDLISIDNEPQLEQIQEQTTNQIQLNEEHNVLIKTTEIINQTEVQQIKNHNCPKCKTGINYEKKFVVCIDCKQTFHKRINCGFKYGKDGTQSQMQTWKCKQCVNNPTNPIIRSTETHTRVVDTQIKTQQIGTKYIETHNVNIQNFDIHQIEIQHQKKANTNCNDCKKKFDGKKTIKCTQCELWYHKTKACGNIASDAKDKVSSFKCKNCIAKILPVGTQCTKCELDIYENERNISCADCKKVYHLGMECNGEKKTMRISDQRSWKCNDCKPVITESNIRTRVRSFTSKAKSFMSVN